MVHTVRVSVLLILEGHTSADMELGYRAPRLRQGSARASHPPSSMSSHAMNPVTVAVSSPDHLTRGLKMAGHTCLHAVPQGHREAGLCRRRHCGGRVRGLRRAHWRRAVQLGRRHQLLVSGACCLWRWRAGGHMPSCVLVRHGALPCGPLCRRSQSNTHAHTIAGPALAHLFLLHDGGLCSQCPALQLPHTQRFVRGVLLLQPSQLMRDIVPSPSFSEPLLTIGHLRRRA